MTKHQATVIGIPIKTRMIKIPFGQIVIRKGKFSKMLAIHIRNSHITISHSRFDRISTFERI